MDTRHRQDRHKQIFPAPCVAVWLLVAGQIAHNGQLNTRTIMASWEEATDKAALGARANISYLGNEMMQVARHWWL